MNGSSGRQREEGVQVNVRKEIIYKEIISRLIIVVNDN